jgi:FtsP/CotA-like multicopper oxidase with cupredoxin domain
VQEDGDALVDEQEHVVMLHDFSFRDPQDIMKELQGGGGLHAGHNMGASHKMPDGTVMKSGEGSAVMLSDIAYDAMLANDRTLDDPAIVKAERGGRFRLRIINGAAASNFWIDLGELEGALVAVDGNGIYPVKGRRFPLAIAQRADIRLSLPPGAGAWPIFFHAEGSKQRSGIILQAGGAEIGKFGAEADIVPALDVNLEAAFRSVYERPDIAVSRTEFLMLTGGGADYKWGLNGKPSMHDVLFSVREGERYEIVMHNMTGMAHPMHLHGHYFKVVSINGQRFDGALRDTVLVPPNMMVAIQFDADNPGTWAFHCHHLYHMNSGMMGAIAYTSAA